MLNLKTGRFIGAMLLSCLLFASSAFAGPVWTFGPEDQGLLKLDYKGQFQLNYRDTGSGSDSDDDTMEFQFRRNRLALVGLYEGFGIYVQTEYREDTNITNFAVNDNNNSSFTLLDAQFRFKYNDAVKFRMGKFKHSLTRENLEACEKPLTLDRSVLIRSYDIGTRDEGIAMWGNLFEDMFQYRVEVMDGRSYSDDAADSSFRYGARAHLTFLDKETGFGYRGTYMGAKKVITLGASYQFEADIAYENTALKQNEVDYQAYSIDFFVEYPVEDVGTFTFSTAYVDYDLDDAYKGGALSDIDSVAVGTNGQKNGGYTKFAYMLPNTPLQFFARAENWSFAHWGVYDQEVDWFGGGLNYYFRGQNLKLTLEYSTVDFDTEVADVCEDFDTLTAQLQVIF